MDFEWRAIIMTALIPLCESLPMHKPLRRKLLLSAPALLLSTSSVFASQSSPVIEIWKSPTCGCCKDWLTYMEKNGFSVGTIHPTGNAGARKALGIPLKFGSCHTAKINGYAIEGHVPAQDVRRLLKEKPDAIGLAAPEMPIGSPGMDGPEYKGQKDRYQVLLIQKDGTATVYRQYN